MYKIIYIKLNIIKKKQNKYKWIYSSIDII